MFISLLYIHDFYLGYASYGLTDIYLNEWWSVSPILILMDHTNAIGAMPNYVVQIDRYLITE